MTKYDIAIRKQGISQHCGETTGSGHQEVCRDNRATRLLKQEDNPRQGNSSLHYRSEYPVSEGTRLKVHKTTGLLRQATRRGGGGDIMLLEDISQGFPKLDAILKISDC